MNINVSEVCRLSKPCLRYLVYLSAFFLPFIGARRPSSGFVEPYLESHDKEGGSNPRAADTIGYAPSLPVLIRGCVCRGLKSSTRSGDTGRRSE